MVRQQPFPELLVLGLICAGFGGSILLYLTLFPDNFLFLTSDEVLLGFVTSVCSFWLAVKIAESDHFESPWVRFFNEFLIGTGIILIVQALLNYLDILTRSFFLILVGGAFAASLLAIVRLLLSSRDAAFQAGTVLVGFDRSSAALVDLLPYPLLGVVGGPANLPGAPAVDFSQLEKKLELWHPQQIIVTSNGAVRIDPSMLLKLRLSGARVIASPELYEVLLGRVCCAGREPIDLVLSQAQSGNTQAMAFQAIYTNLVGLTLLIAAAPLIAAATIAIGLFSGPGPIIETQECCGFQNIPFRRMRFRTRRTDGSGALTRVGRLISRLHLTSLPLLFNLVRGEMALFGPRPVRREFVGPLTGIMPFYSLRSAAKPGILNWGAVQSTSYQVCTCALTEIEYDLYYVKRGSAMLDFEILMRVIFGGKRRKVARREFAPAAR